MSIILKQATAKINSPEAQQLPGRNSRPYLKIMLLVVSFVCLVSNQTAFATGDCNNNNSVSIAEVQTAINMFLGQTQPLPCVNEDGDGVVSIAEVQKTINSFLGVFPIVSVSAANNPLLPYDASSGSIIFEIHPTSTFTYNVKKFAAGDRLIFDTGTDPIFSVWNESGTDGIIYIIGVKNGKEATIHLTEIDPVSDAKVFGANSFRTVFGTDSLLPK